ncbi:MAG TPA: PAS domain S-box protein, partial [Thermoanaerobaculia bacterium]|nr:PAS domain S-box protein [Thermoanaerobaculia bacterium]
VEFIGSILESSTEHSIIGEDLDGNILLWNEGARRLYGYQPEEVVGKANSRILHTEEGVAAGKPQEMRTIALRTGHWEGTVASRCRDGSELNALVMLTLRRDAAARPVGFLLMSRSADRGGAEFLAGRFDSSIVGNMDLERAVSQFALQQAALDAAAAILITDHRGVIRWVNPAFTTTTGFTAEEAIGSTPRILRSDCHPRQFYADFWAAIRSGRVWRGEFINRRKDGSIYYDDQVVTPVRGPGGRISHYVSIMHDVTEQRTAEQKLRVAHQEMRELLEHSPVVLYALAIDGDRVEPRMTSENVMRLLGYLAAETLSHEWWLAHIHPDDRARAAASLGKTMANGSSQTEYRLLHSDGSYRWVEDARRLVHDVSGAPAELVGVWTDITARKEAQEASRETERRLRDMLDNLDLLSAAVDCEGNVTYCNDYFLKLTGWARDEVIGCDWFTRFIAPEERVEMRKFLGLLMAGDAATRHYRNEIVTATGEKRIIQWNNSILRSESGAVIGAATIGEDVTNRVLAERAIIESEERLRIIIDASTDAVWAWNVADGTGYWSDRAYSMLGYDRATFHPARKEFREIVHPDDIALFDRSVIEHLEAAVPFQMRLRLRHSKGFHVPVLVRGQLNRKRAQMVGVFTDLSGLERAGEHIREQAALIDQARDAIVVRDLEDRIVFWSKGAERLYGIAAGDAIGGRFDQLLHIDAGRFEVAKRTVLEEGVWNGEMENTTAVGALITADCRWTLLTDDRDAPKSILGIDTDITEKKSLEQQSFRAQRMESLGTLAGGIAHDLNNLLMPILMGVTLLKRLEPGEMSLRAIRNIENSARRGADLVKQVLLFARGVEGSRTSLDLTAVVREVEAILESTFPKNITFEAKFPHALGRVFGDATQLYQVLLNLCLNARDAMPYGGRLTVSVLEKNIDLHTASMHNGAIAGRYTVIQVSDTGCGMSPEVMDRVFEPFFTTKELSKGTGLGLSTARGIVRSHGGFVAVASKPGKGSSFCVYLPVHTSQMVSEKIETEIEDVTHGHGEVILVVDDEVAILDITRQALLSFGYKVMAADNGADGVAMYQREHARIAAVVTDLMMPGMDGQALIAALRAVDHDVPIIAMSGDVDAAIVPAATTAGATTFLPKPFSAGLMLSTLSRVLSDSVTRASLARTSGIQPSVEIREAASNAE